MNVGTGVEAIKLCRCCRFGQIALRGVMDDESKFLLRTVGRTPDLALFRQEHTANERPQLGVARRHLLQRRIGIREPERLCAALLGAMRVDFTVDAIPDQVRQNVALEELCCRQRRTCWRSQSGAATRAGAPPSNRLCRP